MSDHRHCTGGRQTDEEAEYHRREEGHFVGEEGNKERLRVEDHE